MSQKLPMPDVIVLIPGILGSVLVKDGREVWGVSKIADNLVNFATKFNALMLPRGIGDSDPKDGVTAPRVLPKLYMIPRFFKCDGYGRLAESLKQDFDLIPATADQAGNFLEFPYDWRLSCRFNAQRLSDRVVPVLDRWRATKNPNAKLILICHSLGGLVARYFLEKLNGRELASKLITIGTPYQGAVNALDALANGVFMGWGPIGVSVDKLVRSFPAAYQLLPTYDCLDLGDGNGLHKLSGIALPNIDGNSVTTVLKFHSDIADAVEEHKNDPKYETFAIKGIDHPTNQSASLRNNKIVPLQTYNGENKGGDGTVPRPSSHPPEWADDRASVFVAQKHPMLQSEKSILDQIYGLLTAEKMGKFMGGTGIGLEIPDIVELGKPISVEAVANDGNTKRALQVICHAEDGKPHGGKKIMTYENGRYRAQLYDLPEGAYRITVQSATPASPIEPVSDWTLVWSAAAAA